MRVEPDYVQQPIEEGATPVGLPTRFWLAAQIELRLRMAVDEINEEWIEK
jgi:hypothetical protein